MGLTKSLQKTNLIPVLNQFSNFLAQDYEKKKVEADKERSSVVGNKIVEAFNSLGDNATIEQVNNATKYAIGLSQKYQTPDALKILEPLTKMQEGIVAESQNKTMADRLTKEYGDVLSGINLSGLSGTNALKLIQDRLSSVKSITLNADMTNKSRMVTIDGRTGKQIGKTIELGGMSLGEEQRIQNDNWKAKTDYEAGIRAKVDDKNYGQQLSILAAQEESQKRMDDYRNENDVKKYLATTGLNINSAKDVSQLNVLGNAKNKFQTDYNTEIKKLVPQIANAMNESDKEDIADATMQVNRFDKFQEYVKKGYLKWVNGKLYVNREELKGLDLTNINNYRQQTSKIEQSESILNDRITNTITNSISNKYKAAEGKSIPQQPNNVGNKLQPFKL